MKKRKCTRCGLNRQLKFFKPNGRVCLPCQRRSTSRQAKDVRLKETYNITIEEFDEILETQEGKCAICEGYRSTLDVDHDHRAERQSGDTRSSVRGLLCKRCNRRLLPACLDDTRILMRAVAYLENPPARSVIE